MVKNRINPGGSAGGGREVEYSGYAATCGEVRLAA